MGGKNCNAFSGQFQRNLHEVWEKIFLSSSLFAVLINQWICLGRQTLLCSAITQPFTAMCLSLRTSRGHWSLRKLTDCLQCSGKCGLFTWFIWGASSLFACRTKHGLDLLWSSEEWAIFYSLLGYSCSAWKSATEACVFFSIFNRHWKKQAHLDFLL